MLLIVAFHALVQERIQNDQEQHVDDQYRYHPYDYDDNVTDDGGVSVFVLALASGAEFAHFVHVQFVGYFRQHYYFTVTKNYNN